MTERVVGRGYQEKEIKHGEKLVICASTSIRRQETAKYYFPKAKHSFYFGGTEPNIHDVIGIAKNKIDFVCRFSEEARRFLKSGNPVIVIAADTNTKTLALNQNGDDTYLEDHGKPENAEEVFGTFVRMNEARKLTGTAYYEIVSGSAIAMLNHKKREPSPASESSFVDFDSQKLAFLATPEGFKDYLRTFEDFYKSPIHRLNGFQPTTRITDIAGGLEFPVLTYMGAVSAVDGVERKTPEFKDKFIQTLHNASTGYSPRIVSPFVSKSHMYRLPWLINVAQAVL